MINTKDIGGGYYPLLLCPTCSFEYTHLRSVKTGHQKEDQSRLDTTLYFDCENGHDFFVTFHQYKGYTEVLAHEDTK